MQAAAAATRRRPVIENVSAQGELVGIQLYGHPWVTGEYWPMITPCFQIRAIDDAGDEPRACRRLAGLSWK